MRSLFLLAVCTFISLAFGCKEISTTPDVNDHDVLTTFELTLIQNQQPRDTIIVVWQDKDGAGGADPDRIDTLRLDSGRTYYGTVRLLNASKTPPEDLTTTIRSEEEVHQFFYVVQPTTLCAATILDKDANDLPVGLSLDLSPLAPGSGTLSVMLCHYVTSTNKDGTTPSDETDLSIEIPLVIK